MICNKGAVDKTRLIIKSCHIVIMEAPNYCFRKFYPNITTCKTHKDRPRAGEMPIIRKNNNPSRKNAIQYYFTIILPVKEVQIHFNLEIYIKDFPN